MPRPDPQAHLGEVINPITPAMSPIRRRVQRKQLRWIEDGTALAMATIGSAVISMLIMLAVYAAFTVAARSSLQ